MNIDKRTAAGIGDFRGKAGKWTEESQKREEHSQSGVSYVDLRPTYTHEAILYLLEDAPQQPPNSTAKPRGYIKYIITQNCDALHRLSGVPGKRISELHGCIFQEYCASCGEEYIRPYYVCDDNDGCLDDDTLPWPEHMEECPRCNNNHFTGRCCTEKGCHGKLRDNIIHFGDFLNETILSHAEEAADQCDLMLSFGTTMLITPASNLVTKNKKNKLVIVNRQVTKLDKRAVLRVFADCDVVMRYVMKALFASEKEQQELEEWMKYVTSVKCANYDRNRADTPKFKITYLSSRQEQKEKEKEKQKQKQKQKRKRKASPDKQKEEESVQHVDEEQVIIQNQSKKYKHKFSTMSKSKKSSSLKQ